MLVKCFNVIDLTIFVHYSTDTHQRCTDDYLSHTNVRANLNFISSGTDGRLDNGLCRDIGRGMYSVRLCAGLIAHTSFFACMRRLIPLTHWNVSLSMRINENIPKATQPLCPHHTAHSACDLTQCRLRKKLARHNSDQS